MSLHCRFAPTPSGYLHQGNLANALLNSWLAASLEAPLLLRIDRDDITRVRTEYEQYIHDALSALTIEYDRANTTRADRREYLKAQLALIPANLLFACACSRTDLLQRACTCASKDLSWLPGVNALRLQIPPETEVLVDNMPLRIHDHFGDVILWRRDDIPAYHWANVIDDRDLQISHVVRGIDLRSSTALHIHLADIIDATGVRDCTYLHHSLLVDSRGDKLSKSTQANALAPTLDSEYLESVHTAARALAHEIGIESLSV